MPRSPSWLYLLKQHPVRLVGSALSKKKPRDIDLVMEIPDELFVELFGSIEKWVDEGETGQWTDIRSVWSNCCVQLSKELWRRFGVDKQVDLKIIPKSLPEYGKH